MDTLLKQFNLRDTKLETIQPAATLEWNKVAFLTKIDDSREDSITFESTDNADFKVFSDGSGQDNGIGSAAILYEKGRIPSIKTRQFHLGTPDKHNTYEAEVIGAILALGILENTPETVGRNVTLYIDNQSVIKALPTLKATSGQYLLRAFRATANRIGRSEERRVGKECLE